jgi:pantoate kinase
MQSLERLEQFGASVVIRHHVNILAGYAENDAQALRDLKSVYHLLKSLTEEAKERAHACEVMGARL